MQNPTVNPESGEYIDLAVHFRVLWRNARFIAAGCLLGAGLAVTATLLLPKRYTAVSSLLPAQETKEMTGMLSRFEGMAASMGFGGAAGGIDPTAYMEDILRSRRLARILYSADFADPAGGERKPLHRLLKIEAADDTARFDAFHDVFGRALGMKKADNGAVKVHFTAWSPALAAEALNRTVKEFETFHRDTRLLKARENLKFVEQRLAEERDSLARWEYRLKDFKDNNQDVSRSSELQMRLRELLRNVSVHEEVYTLLRKEFEMARLQEEKERPIISVLDSAETPLRHSFPQRKKTVAAALFLSLLLFSALTLILNAMAGGRPGISRWVRTN